MIIHPESYNLIIIITILFYYYLMDQEFDKKFQNLFDKIIQQFPKENETFDQFDKLLQKKHSDLLSKINSKTEAKCKEQKENIILFSEYQNINNNNNEMISLPGYEKEYDEAMNKFKQCAENYYAIDDEFQNVNLIFNDLIMNSTQSCLRECKNDILKHKHTEYEAGKCVQSCVRYRNYNIQARFKLIFDTLDEYHDRVDKL